MTIALFQGAGARNPRVPALFAVVSLLCAIAAPAMADEPQAGAAPSAAEDGAETGSAAGKTKKDKKKKADDAAETAAPAEPAPEAVPEAADGAMNAAGAKQQQGAVVQQLEAGSGVRIQTMCTNCNQANLTVNGVTGSDHVLVTYDDQPAVGGLGTAYVLTQIPSEFIGYSHVTRGPGSVMSGAGGMGGTIEFHSAPRTDERHGFLDLIVGDWGSRTVRAAGSDRWGPVGAFAYVQGVKQDGFDTSGDDSNDVATFERATYQGLFDFHLTDRQMITIGGTYYGEDQKNGPGANLPRENTALEENAKFNWKEYTLRYEWTAASGLELTFNSNYSRRFQWQEAAAFLGGDLWRYLRVNDERSFFRTQAKMPLGKAGLLTGGVEYSKLQLRVHNLETFFLPYITDGLEHFGTYVEWAQTVGSKWDYSAGGRYDDYVVFGWTTPRNGTRTQDPDLPSSYFLPRAKVNFRPSAKVTVGFAAGRTAIAPTPVFEKTCCGAKYARSREAKPERAWSYQAMIEAHPTADMRLTATAFQTDFKDYLLRAVVTQTASVPEYANINLPEVKVQGIDVVHDMRFKGNRYNVGWTFTYSDPTDGDGAWIPYLPRQAASAYFRYDSDRRHTKINFDVRWTGSMRHYLLDPDAPYRSAPSGYRKSEDFVSADVSFEHPIGRKGWAVHGGISNLTDYVMSDLTIKDTDASGDPDQFERCFDWGPLTGRYAYVGFKFDH